jgi:uncharacterized protein
MIGFGAPANYFAHSTYFRWDMGRGIVRERSGARVMAFPQEFSIGIFAGLIEECGDAWPIVLQSCGTFWGKRQMERIEAELSAFHGARLRSLPTAVAHAAISECLAVHGWGRVEFELSQIQRRILLIRVDESPMARAVLDSSLEVGNRPVDAMLAGALAAMFTHASGATMECKEIRCKANGDPICEFVLASEGRLAGVPMLLRQRASREEILASI